jgi:hypothetical protein
MTAEPVKPPVEDVNLSAIAAEIARMNGRRIVAIDGVDGAGKTRFADKLAPLVAANGLSSIADNVFRHFAAIIIQLRIGAYAMEGGCQCLHLQDRCIQMLRWTYTIDSCLA